MWFFVDFQSCVLLYDGCGNSCWRLLGCFKPALFSSCEHRDSRFLHSHVSSLFRSCMRPPNLQKHLQTYVFLIDFQDCVVSLDEDFSSVFGAFRVLQTSIFHRVSLVICDFLSKATRTVAEKTEFQQCTESPLHFRRRGGRGGGCIFAAAGPVFWRQTMTRLGGLREAIK